MDLVNRRRFEGHLLIYMFLGTPSIMYNVHMSYNILRKLFKTDLHPPLAWLYPGLKLTGFPQLLRQSEKIIQKKSEKIQYYFKNHK